MVTGIILALTLQSASLEVVSSGATQMLGGYMPQRLALSTAQPDGIKKAPALNSPVYGLLKFAGRDYIVVVDGQKLYVDSNGDGDLTNDGATEWATRAYAGANQESYTQMNGGFNVVHPTLKKPLHMGAYLFDPNDAARPQLKNVLLYYSDYALKGSLQFGKSTHSVLIADRMATGVFAGDGVMAMIDRDDDGKYDGRYEYYALDKPFNIEGTTYDFVTSGIGQNQLGIKRSATTVAEVPAPPNLAVGRKVLAFDATTTDGTKVKFPSTYKGKLVMLDFWATWCGPCVGELPNVTKAYEQFHDRGFEILSISLDQKDSLEKLNTFTKEHNMPWRQVYDGKYWDAEIAKMYGIQAIPAVFLVDGDTGTILADARTLRGEAIFTTLDTQLTKKFGK